MNLTILHMNSSTQLKGVGKDRTHLLSFGKQYFA